MLFPTPTWPVAFRIRPISNRYISFDLKCACNSLGSSRSTNNYAATPTVFSRQSQFRLTVKMAPTIEYPAQHCEVSPKSLHMVLFYITNIFVLVLFVYDPVRNTATTRLESLGYCCYCCYCSIGDAIHNPPAVYYRRATSKDVVRFASKGPISQRGYPSWPARSPPRYIQNLQSRIYA